MLKEGAGMEWRGREANGRYHTANVSMSFGRIFGSKRLILSKPVATRTSQLTPLVAPHH